MHSARVVAAIALIVSTTSTLGIVRQLTPVPQSRTHMCDGDIMICICTVIGRHLKWLDSLQFVFASGDRVNDVRSQGSIKALLLSNTRLTSGEWELSSMLFANVSVLITLSSNITCSSDNDTRILKSNISGVPESPSLTNLTWLATNKNVSLYRLEWKPPGNTDQFELDYYELEFGQQTLRVSRDQTSTILSVLSEQVIDMDISISAVNMCGRQGNFLSKHFHVVSEQSMNYAHQSCQDFKDKSRLKLITITILLSIFAALLSTVLFLTIVLLVHYKRKLKKLVASHAGQVSVTAANDGVVRTARVEDDAIPIECADNKTMVEMHKQELQDSLDKHGTASHQQSIDSEQSLSRISITSMCRQISATVKSITSSVSSKSGDVTSSISASFGRHYSSESANSEEKEPLFSSDSNEQQ